MSNACGLMTSFIAAASMMQSSNAISGNDSATRPQVRKNKPSLSFRYVRFVNARNPFATLSPSSFEREAGDSFRRSLGDNSQTFDDAGHDFVLQAAV